jgi:hypothetical protein
MKSVRRGASTSAVEVTHVSSHGLWVLLPDGEVFLPYEQFPWFKEATIREVLHVKLLHGRHLYWPDLDVDLSVESLRQPDQFPLVSRGKVRRKEARRSREKAGARRGSGLGRLGRRK